MLPNVLLAVAFTFLVGLHCAESAVIREQNLPRTLRTLRSGSCADWCKSHLKPENWRSSQFTFNSCSGCSTSMSSFLRGTVTSGAEPDDKPYYTTDPDTKIGYAKYGVECIDNEAPMEGWENPTCAGQLAAGHCDQSWNTGNDGYCRHTCGICQTPAEAKAALQGKEVQTRMEEPEPFPFSVFVSVFSARENQVRREVIRDLFEQTSDQVKTSVEIKFHVCKNSNNVDDVDEQASVEEDLQKEEHLYGDLAFLQCEEGHERGKMAEKAVLAMQHYRREEDRFNQSMFMHIEDDIFVPWTRLLEVLRGFKNMDYVYMGIEIPDGTPVNRDSTSEWYQPPEVWANDSYPQYLRKEAYILGKDLVFTIMDSSITKELPLTNQDQALGVWVDQLKKRGTPAFTLVVDPPTKNADGLQIPYSACGDTWARYPFMWQHGLAADDMRCLGQKDALNSNTEPIDTCLTDCEAVR